MSNVERTAILRRAQILAAEGEDAQVTHAHVLGALFERADVQSLLVDLDVEDPYIPLILFTLDPGIQRLSAIVQIALMKSRPIRKLLADANLVLNLGTEKSPKWQLGPETFEPLTLALHMNAKASLGIDPKTGAIRPLRPISLQNAVTAIAYSPPFINALVENNVDQNRMREHLADLEKKLIDQFENNPQPPGKVLTFSPNLALLDSRAEADCTQQGTGAFYALNMFAQIVAAHDSIPELTRDQNLQALIGYTDITAKSCRAMINGRVAAEQNQKMGEKPNDVEQGVTMTNEPTVNRSPLAKAVELREASRDLNQEAVNALVKDDQSALIRTRDKDIDRLIEILMRRDRNNAVIEGEQGVGKLATIKGLAQRIVEGRVPEELRHKTILLLDHKSLKNNFIDRTRNEARFRDILKGAAEAKNDIFLAVEDFADLPEQFEAVLKPFIDDKKFQIIVTATPDTKSVKIDISHVYRKAFTSMEVKPADEKSTLEILRAKKNRYEQLHNVFFPDSVLPAIVQHSENNREALPQPTAAIDYLERVAVRTRLNNDTDRKTTPDGKRIVTFADIETIDSESDVKGVLALYCRDLVKLAEDGKLPPVVERNDEIDRLSRSLFIQDKNSAVLLGETGVGKTAVVEGLAQKIANHEISTMEGRKIFALDMGLVIAGTKYRGEFEQRLKDIVKVLSSDLTPEGLPKNIIFLDELHSTVGAGSAEGSFDASSILKPALARGEISAIGATTFAEYKKMKDRDAPFARRFNIVKVLKPDDEKARRMLEGARGRLETFHKVHANDAFYDACIEYSNRYTKEDSNQPDIGKTLANLTLARVKASPKYPVGPDGYKTASLEALSEEIYDQKGIMVGTLADGEPEDPEIFIPAMKKEVFFQDGPIEALGHAVAAKRSGHANENKPTVIALFGKTGVGKTEIGYRQLRKLTKRPGKKFNMGAYTKETSVNRLIGSDRGYVDSDKGGILTEFVKQNPYCVVCLDELEKAHPDILRMLLSVFEDGEVEDGLGETVDFKNVIFTLTSNVQLSKKAKVLGFNKDGKVEKYSADLLSDIVAASDEKFSPEFVNRLDEIIFCNDLPGKEQMVPVMELLLDNLKSRRANRHLGMRISDDAISHLLDKGGTDLKFGARPYLRIVEREVQRDISKAAWKHHKAASRSTYDPKVDTIVDIDVKPDGSGLTFAFTTAAEEKRRLGPKASFNFHAGLMKNTPGPANQNLPPPPMQIPA